MKARFLILAALLPMPLSAQIPNPVFSQVTTAPTTCGNGVIYALTTTIPWTYYGPTASGACQTVGSRSAGGTVTSVTFTGDGILDSSTPSTAVTTAGTVVATPLTQTANTVLAGPTTGSAASPSFRALVSADIPNNAANTTGSAGSTTAALTMNNSGSGATSGSTFNGSAAETISYNTVGAAPSVTAGTIRSYCTGTATSSATLYMWLLGSSVSTCTTTTSNAAWGFQVTHTGVLKNLTVRSVTAGTSVSSGVFLITDEGSSTGITCTIGTGTTCSDTAHTYTVTAGHYVFVDFTTQGSETLANIGLSFDFQ